MVHRSLLLLALLSGCVHDSFVGHEADASSNDAPVTADAAVNDAPVNDAPVNDASPGADALCTCDQSSCGSRLCGRSTCGYPCGECASDDWCTGSTCAEGVGPGVGPCIDAFGGEVWEGGQGLRVCPTDASMLQLCYCGGGGATAWAVCSPTCQPVCSIGGATASDAGMCPNANGNYTLTINGGACGGLTSGLTVMVRQSGCALVFPGPDFEGSTTPMSTTGDFTTLGLRLGSSTTYCTGTYDSVAGTISSVACDGTDGVCSWTLTP